MSLPTALAKRLAAPAERRGLPVSDLLAEYAAEDVPGTPASHWPTATPP